MVFPAVVMYECESWTIKKAERWRIDAFELWCWRRLLRVPWTSRRSNQSILKKISPEYSLEGLMLKVKLQSLAIWCEELTHWKRPWFWERLRGGGEGDDRGWEGWMASPTQRMWVWVNSGSWWWTGRPGMLHFMGVGEANSQTQLNWTEYVRRYQGRALKKIREGAVAGVCGRGNPGVIVQGPWGSIMLCVEGTARRRGEWSRVSEEERERRWGWGWDGGWARPCDLQGRLGFLPWGRWEPWSTMVRGGAGP